MRNLLSCVEPMKMELYLSFFMMDSVRNPDKTVTSTSKIIKIIDCCTFVKLLQNVFILLVDQPVRNAIRLSDLKVWE